MPACCRVTVPQVGLTLVVNDIHSQLNPTRVAEIAEVDSVAAIQSAIARARSLGLPVCVAGGRHAMGGQQFCEGGLLIDTRPLARVIDFDQEQGVLTVEAGIQWPAVLSYLDANGQPDESSWAIAQKQTGADRLSLGGAVAANAHGRGLAMPPLVGDLEEITLVDADGVLHRCCRTENRELFRLVVGGYGLFGVVWSLRLRLVPRRTLERVVEVRDLDGLDAAFERRIAEGHLYGDFQFAIDPASDDFLRRGVFSCYRPVPDDPPVPAGQHALSREDWQRLIYLAHADKSRAFAEYADHYVKTSGQLYHSDAHQYADYLDGYHALLDERTGAPHPATEMITEIYVPRARLADFMAEVAADFRESRVEVIYGTVRVVERDEVSFLAWAREPWACVIFNIHTVHTREGIEHTADAFRRLIDYAIARGGSYYLTYHRWATPEQLEACYPQIRAFLARKGERDPDERFQSDWYRHLRSALGE
jgi:FAD/FMN-containing dehydrogenase